MSRVASGTLLKLLTRMAAISLVTVALHLCLVEFSCDCNLHSVTTPSEKDLTTKLKGHLTPPDTVSLK